MTGADRREQMIRQIQESNKPISGKELALCYHVSRQVIVQDIALIRAAGYDVISTNRGYMLQIPAVANRVFKVRHTDEQIEEELYAIVDLGGCVEDVFVNHKVYGRVEAALNVNSRRNAAEFLESIRSGKSSPLKNITSGYHYHTVSADSVQTLDMIEEMLRRKGILVED